MEREIPPLSGKSLRNQGKLRLFTDLLWTKINIFPKNKTDLPSVATEKGAKCFFLQKKTFVFSSKDFVSI